MLWAFIQSKASDLLGNPVIKLITAAGATLFATPTELIIAVLCFWTLNLGAQFFYLHRQCLPLQDFEFKEFYTKIILHIFTLIGLTLLANILDAKFVQIYGFGTICTTEFISILRYCYGDQATSVIIRDIADITGIDELPKGDGLSDLHHKKGSPDED